MKNYTVKIQDREAGNEIAKFHTLAEAQTALEKYEADDKEEGTFTPDFYEIVVIDTLAENVKKAGSSKSEAKKAASKENGKLGGRPRRIVACANCGAKAKIGWITAMEKAGFGVRHLACKECGQSALKED